MRELKRWVEGVGLLPDGASWGLKAIWHLIHRQVSPSSGIRTGERCRYGRINLPPVDASFAPVSSPFTSKNISAAWAPYIPIGEKSPCA
eukprot:8156546-Pyramimonas_sp.AAC.1